MLSYLATFFMEDLIIGHEKCFFHHMKMLCVSLLVLLVEVRVGSRGVGI